MGLLGTSLWSCIAKCIFLGWICPRAEGPDLEPEPHSVITETPLTGPPTWLGSERVHVCI